MLASRSLAVLTAVSCLFLAGNATSAFAQQAAPAKTYDLKPVYKKGDVSKHKGHLVLAIDQGGQNVDIEVEVQTETTVKDLPAAGGVVMTEVAKSVDVSMGGNTVQHMDEQKPEDITFDALGIMLGTTSDEAGYGFHMARMTSLVFAGKAVALGEEWKVEYAKDEAHELVAGTATFKVTKEDTLDGKAVIVVESTYKETDGANPVTSTGTFWLDATTLEPLKTTHHILNFPVPQAGTTAKTADITTTKV